MITPAPTACASSLPNANPFTRDGTRASLSLGERAGVRAGDATPRASLRPSTAADLAGRSADILVRLHRARADADKNVRAPFAWGNVTIGSPSPRPSPQGEGENFAASAGLRARPHDLRVTSRILGFGLRISSFFPHSSFVIRHSAAALLLTLALCRSAAATDTTFTYDAAGRLLAADFGNGAFITYAYDANGNLVASRHAPTNAAPAPANLSVTVAYPDGPALAGAPFRCVVTVTNAGPGLARDTRLTNALPAGATVLATTTTQGHVTAANGFVALDLGALAPNTAAIVELTLQIPAPAPPPLVATVTSPNDTTPADNTASAAPSVNAAVNLSLTGHAGPSPLTLGSKLRYDFTALNAAATAASGVVLTSRFSASATFIAATSSAGTITTNVGEIVFSLGTLAPGASATASLTIAPATAGSFTNLATLAAGAPELTPADNALALVTPTQTPTLLVVNTNNAGPGSLRQAILDANVAPDRDIIGFQITGTGGLVPTIAVVTSNLPNVLQPVVIDGFTQPEGLVELTGLDTRLLLTLRGGDSAVRGLVLNRSAVSGLRIETNGNNVVEGCLIGCAPDGLTGRRNGGDGITILGFAVGNRIGGPEPWQRNLIGTNNGNGIGISLGGGNLIQGNFIGLGADGSTRLGNNFGGVALNESVGDVIAGNVISGNGLFAGDGIAVSTRAGDTLIVGNRIGTDANGTAARPNLSSGISVNNAFGVAIGDGTPAGRNVIAGNAFRGIDINTATGVRIAGNYLGTDATGTQRLPNAGAGVVVAFAPGVVIGGAGTGEGNVISGNSSHGVDLQSGAHRTVILGNIIGLDAAGAQGLSNALSGVSLQSVVSNRVGGPLPGEGNVISGNTSHGITLNAFAHFNIIQGNFIGTDATGMLARSNNLNGVNIAGGSTNLIGGLAPGEGNLISGNGFDGVSVTGTTTTNRIEGNWLGVDATGAAPLGNRLGVSTFNSARGTRIEGNLISGNRSSGLQLTHVSGPGAVVVNNFIGTDATGLSAVSNTNPGVLISRSPNNIIGPGNVIGGNGRSGITLAFTNTFNNVVVGNRIGVGADGLTPVPNQLVGIHLFGAATNRIGGALPGEGNVIAFNQAHGVQVRFDATDPAALSAFANAVLGNAIFANGGLGLENGGTAEGVGDGPDANDAGDADDGPNRRQNFPVLAAATTTNLSGSITSAPGATFRVEFFVSEAADPSGFGEGQTFLGATEVTTDGAGVAAFNMALPLSFSGPRFLTATATDAVGNTSEFSPALLLDGGTPPPPVLGDLTILPDGRFQFAFSAQPGASYTIESSTNLVNWLTLLTTNAPGPLVIIPDGHVGDFPALFFRVRSP